MATKSTRSFAPSKKLPRDILLVDDEPAIARVMARALGRLVRRVDHARSALHAVRALESRRYHVLVSDQRMAGGLGSDLLNRSAERWPSMRLVLMSGWVDAELLALCPAANRIVDKSFPLDRIVEVILEEAYSAPPLSP